MIRRPPRSTQSRSSAASDVYKRQSQAHHLDRAHVSLFQLKAFVFWYGAIAQLGERVLCKHEVVGSIPSGSTRWFNRYDRLAEAMRQNNSSAKHRFAAVALMGAVCGISDIVKRRSIRVGSCKQLRGPPLSPDHFGARPSQDGWVVNDPFSEA